MENLRTRQKVNWGYIFKVDTVFGFGTSTPDFDNFVSLLLMYESSLKKEVFQAKGRDATTMHRVYLHIYSIDVYIIYRVLNLSKSLNCCRITV